MVNVTQIVVQVKYMCIIANLLVYFETATIDTFKHVGHIDQVSCVYYLDVNTKVWQSEVDSTYHNGMYVCTYVP